MKPITPVPLPKPEFIPDRAWRVIMRVCSAHGLTYRAVAGPTTMRHIVAARRDAAIELRRMDPNYSHRAIGEYLGNRDHSTIVALCKGKASRTWNPIPVPCDPVGGTAEGAD